jgi:hypothetical protein
MVFFVGASEEVDAADAILLGVISSTLTEVIY